jgi:superoxide dismutase
LKSKPSSGERSLEVLSAIDEEYGGFDIVFLTQFTEKDLGQCGRRR